MIFSLVMTLTDGTKRKFPIRESKTVIGRESRCHVRIALPRVADRHCELLLKDGELNLRDLGSETGTLVNGEAVRKTVLGHADELTVGPVTFQVHAQRQADAEKAEKSARAESEIEINLESGAAVGAKRSESARSVPPKPASEAG